MRPGHRLLPPTTQDVSDEKWPEGSLSELTKSRGKVGEDCHSHARVTHLCGKYFGTVDIAGHIEAAGVGGGEQEDKKDSECTSDTVVAVGIEGNHDCK